MFGKKKGTDGYDGELRKPGEELPEGYDLREEEYPEDAVYEEYAPEDDYGEDEGSNWGADDEEDWEETEERPESRSIFRPEIRKPNFVVSVLLNSVRVLLVIALLGGVAAVGAVLGIAKGYVDTAPELNLVELDSQAQTSFIYDRNKNLITEYKGTENRVLVSNLRTPS